MSRKQVAVRRLRAVFEPEEGGWLVSIPEVQGCFSDGRSLSEARRNIREALATCVDVFGADTDRIARDAILDEEIRLSTDARRVLAHAKKLRQAAESAQKLAQKESVRAALKLTRSAKLSLRDAGELLGISHQRVKQLASG